MKLAQDFGVRALMGVLVVIPAMGTLSYLAIRGSSEALTAIATMCAAIIFFFFGTRSKA